MEEIKLWEVLVPASNYKDGEFFSYEHHRKWDDFVKKITGGLTVMKSAKGEWVKPDSGGQIIKDRIIPVRIACSKNEIDIIIDFTLKHYCQDAVMAYLISEQVIIKHKKDESN